MLVNLFPIITTFALTIICEAFTFNPKFPTGFSSSAKFRTPMDFLSMKDYTSVMIVPTGIAASIGGYAGDALPSAKLISTQVDCLITHPNVMNGAMLYWPIENCLYVEGYTLDEFSAGNIGLERITNGGHKIGIILDSSIEEDLKVRHIQVANAARATLGIDVDACIITSDRIGVEVKVSSSGASWGTIENQNVLLESANILIERGCTAVAVVARFPEDESEEEMERFEKYKQGLGVDGIAGAEALISHIISKNLKIPCAHAPAFLPTDPDPNVNPKACAEELGYTFLPCVLAYLHRAPRLVDLEQPQPSQRSPFQSQDSLISRGLGRHVITNEDVDSVIVPSSALGGPAVLSFLSQGKLIVAVEDNTTCMKADKENLRLVSDNNTRNRINIVSVRSYAEAAGVIAAHRHGILLDSITSNVPPVTVIDLSRKPRPDRKKGIFSKHR